MAASSTSRTVETAPGLLGAVVLLAIAQATLGQFVGHGVPLFLRSAGQPSHIIGLVYIASLPYILKVIWAPLIDRNGNPPFGHYRGWIVAGQLLASILLAVLSATSPAGSPYALITVVTLLMVVMATQEAATSGLMVKSLAPADRARGAAFRAAGSAFAGAIVGAGAIYLLSDFGWTVVVAALAGFTLLILLPVTLLRLDRGDAPPAEPPSYIEQFTLFRKTEARRLLFVKVLVGIGLALTYGLKSIVLVDAGFSVADAALVSLVAGSAVAMISVLAVRPLVDLLGGYAVLALCGLGVAVLCGTFSVLFSDGLSKAETVVYVLSANALTFAAYPASRSLLMAYCETSRAATDFSAFVSIEGVFLLLTAGIGAMLADTLGISQLLIAASVGSVIGAALASRAAWQEMRVRKLSKAL